MPLGKGGSSGSQSGTSNSQTAGNASTAGFNGSVAMPIAPQGYESAWRSILGQGGNTPGQTAALNFFQQPGGNNLLNPEGNGWYGAIDRNNNLQSLATPGGFASTYGPPPTSATPGLINSNPAASFMQPYQQGYTNDVVNATGADLANKYGQAMNASNMAGTAAGGFANSRMGLRDAQTTDDFLRNMALTSGTLRNQGFQTAMQGGQFDAGQNQAAQGQNISNLLNNSQFNSTLSNNRDQFGANAMMGANAQQMNNTVAAGGIGMNAANSAANIGGQTFGQNLSGLAAGAPLFGQSNKGGQLGANDMAGNSDTQSSGKNSSKGGGLSIG